MLCYGEERACWWNLPRCFLWLWVIQGQMGWLLRYSPQGGCVVLYLFVYARSILCFLGLPVLYCRSRVYPLYIFLAWV